MSNYRTAVTHITKAANAGTDQVKASVSYTLGADLENLVLTGSAAITGNGAANVLNGGREMMR